LTCNLLLLAAEKHKVPDYFFFHSSSLLAASTGTGKTGTLMLREWAGLTQLPAVAQEHEAFPIKSIELPPSAVCHRKPFPSYTDVCLLYLLIFTYRAAGCQA
jgi:hypothetical protein